MLEKFQGLIFKTVYSVVGSTIDRADVEDIVQDVNLHLMTKALGAHDPTRGELSTFIHTVARNLTIDYLRSRPWVREQSLDNTDEHGDPIGIDLATHGATNEDVDALAVLIKHEQEQRLAAAIKELEPEDRLFLRVVLSDDFDAESYAAKREITPVAVRVRKSRIADKLRQLIKRLDQE